MVEKVLYKKLKKNVMMLKNLQTPMDKAVKKDKKKRGNND